ncbi:uncharacterized protein MELLADRAFT_91126 [Melampsora larici-populina 98AG31]|uniref:Uncharacterized protein n=1 Tax=Melampsora larici-populina (strain 98AG31 / pathotype 3-4-7) TaxID=747676 RepID=F4R782_MELLP|nr:uncharacterized protein MELLADRAFT_91126 [Melampsora larici-populina 98AG31]EGG11546.1 hypothetical protein MELLADRAFT_91126 [Melampsora larici-populina 98AG31]
MSSSPITSNHTGIDASSNPITVTPGTPIHISNVTLSAEAAKSILELIMSTRGSAERNPVSIPITAHPSVKQGIDQCMNCGIFGHRTFQCAHVGRTPEGIPEWRRTTNGKIYSVKALLGMHPYQKWTMDTLLEDHSSQNMKTRSTPPFETPAVETIDLNTPSPTPRATTSKTITSSRSKGKETLHQAFNPVVTPWNDWSKVWSWKPKSVTAAAAISEAVAGRNHIPVTVGRALVLSRSD